MIIKEASFKFTNINPLFENKNDQGMIRTASGRIIIEPGSDKEKVVKSAIKKHPNALFFRAKAIKADEENSNGDYFSVDELLKSYKSFEGVPFFTNHDNQNVENARGKVIFAEWDEDEKAVYTISFIDRDAYPHICRSIEEEYVTGVSMGAINAGSKILMADFSTKNIEEVNEGDMVLSHKMMPQKVSKVHSDYLGKDMFEIEAKTYHRSPLFTEDHPVFHISKEEVAYNRKQSLALAQKNKYERGKNYTTEFIGQDTWRSNNYNATFKEASCLSVDDYIMIPSRYKLSNEINDLDGIYYLYGAFLGGGYLIKDKNGDYCGVSFCFNINEIELSQRITNIINVYTGKDVDIKLCEERNGMYLTVYDKYLSNELSRLFGSGAKNKRLNADVKTHNQASKLISGYLDTDGCLVDKTNQDVRGNKFGGFQISSSNIELLEDVQNLLIGMGYVSRLSTANRKPSRGSVVNISTIEHTLSIGSNAHEIFEDSIKYSKSYFVGNETLAGQSFVTEIDGVKYMACPIKRINIIDNFDEPVYDLTVENDESYIADGMSVHNCSVEYSVCNICGNKAESTDQYCTHIRNRKGRKFTGSARNVNTGEVKHFKDHPVYEYNYGLKFIELSAVVDPACPTCHIEGIIPNDEYLSKVANMENSFRMVRTAAIEKKASQEEIDQIEECLGTLEQIAVNLIQNRKQVEMEFSSDLVKIMSDLQSWLEELVGAGYGNVETSVPGTVGDAEPGEPGESGEMEGMEGEPPVPDSMQMGQPGATGQPPSPQAVSDSVGDVSDQSVGSVSGSPVSPSVTSPELPITAPVRPRTSDINDSRTIQRVASNRIDNGRNVVKLALDLKDKLEKVGGKDMGGRRTTTAKQIQKDKAIEILSNSWKEKQDFFEYIKQVPSIQNNEHRLSVNKRDDSFIIVAENKDRPDDKRIWTYEDLTGEEREKIIENPKDAAIMLLNTFANNLNNQKEGVNKMTDINRQAGATTVQEQPDQITEKQLDRQDLYHARNREDKHEVTQKQLESQRKGEKNELTEGQLDDAELKQHPRQGAAPEVITEKQFDGDNRVELDKHEVTQKQLSNEGYKTGKEPNVITEKQLQDTPAPWARTANRDSSLFKTASEHMNSVVDVMADATIKAGCTPEETCVVASGLVSSLENRYNLAVSLLEGFKEKENIDYAKRVAFWQNKNLKVASTGTKEIAELIVDGLRAYASDETYSPDVLMDAIDVISEEDAGVENIAEAIEKKISEANSSKKQKASVRSELRASLKKNKIEKNASEDKSKRDNKRKEILASLENEKEEDPVILNEKGLGEADTLIDTSFEEIGLPKESSNTSSFKKEIVSFARGALASQNIRMGSITNVTISGDTIQIAVQTDTEENEVNIDTGEGSTEIPVGGVEGDQEMAPAPEELPPEGDASGEGLGGAWASKKKGSKGKMERTAQSPMGGGMGAPGGVAAPGAPEQALPGPSPEGDPVQALTTDVSDDIEIPATGERQMPWTICPECGSIDVDVNNEGGDIKGTCNNCGAEYEALIKKEIEFKIIKPTKSVGEEGVESPESPEAPEVPALPVAARTKLGKDSIIRIANNKEKHGHVCPSCGKKGCVASSEQDGHVEFECGKCGTKVEKDFIVSASNPQNGYLRVTWDVFPEPENCEGCVEEAKKFASELKVNKMLRTASANADSFPSSACMERLARKYGGDTIATFGPCKGKLLAECVCNELKRLGFRKIRHLNKFASISMEKDPWDECIEDQTKNEGHDLKEAEVICSCIKKKWASDEMNNIYHQAFAEDVEQGLEKDLTIEDLATLDNLVKQEKMSEVDKKRKALAALDEEDIGSELPPLDSVEVEVEVVNDESAVEASTEEKIVEASEENEDEADIQAETEEKTVEASEEETKEETEEDIVANASEENEDDIKTESEEDNLQVALSMNGKRVRKTNEEVLKMASSPKRVKDIEGNVESGVPRGKANIRNEGSDNIDVPLNKPSVPRANAEMGNEGADNINPKAGLPDVAVDSAYMGHEKEVQKGYDHVNKGKGMPEINNDIKGTVIAKEEKEKRQAKKMKEIDTVEDNVEAKVPRTKETIKNESPDNIDVPLNTPKVPRANAEMGNEGADNINPKAEGPDVPVDNAYMGHEKEVQKGYDHVNRGKGMPEINDEILKQVRQKRQVQLDKISQARKNEAVQTAAWLVANNRIDSDKETFDTVVQALTNFETDKIHAVASKMFPEKTKRTSSDQSKKVEPSGHAIPAIVQSSKEEKDGEDLQTRLANSFTIGNSQFDRNLTIYGDK